MALAKFYEDISDRFYENTDNCKLLNETLLSTDPDWEQRLKKFDILYDCLSEWSNKGTAALEELIETERKIAQQFECQPIQTTFSVAMFENQLKLLKDILKKLGKYYKYEKDLKKIKSQQAYNNALNEYENAIKKAEGIWLKYKKAYQEIKANILIRPTPEQLTRLWLDEEQEKFVLMDYQGYRRIQGVSGSGKTLILVHRALRLAVENPQKTVRVFTISRELSSEIQYLLEILSPHKKIPHNIVIEAFSEFLFGIIKLFEPNAINCYKLKQCLNTKTPTDESIQTRNGINDSWLAFIDHLKDTETLFLDPQVSNLLQYLENSFKKGAQNSIHSYLYQELDYVRSLSSNDNYLQYKEIERLGRAIRFNADHREAILKILKAWDEWLSVGHLIDSLALVQKAYKFFSQPNDLEAILKHYPTDYVLIDEMQDFSTLELEILLKLFEKPLEQKNALFMAGDLNQKIYIKEHRSNLAKYNFKGRSNNLKKNYRNSHSILKAALSIVNKYPSVSQEIEKTEILNLTEYEFSKYSGQKPHVFSFKPKTEFPEISRFILENYQKLGSIAVLVPDYDSLISLEQIISNLNVQFRRLLGNEQFNSWQSPQKTNQTKYVIGVYEDAKGFEFDTVFLLKLSKNNFPRPHVPEEEIYREAAILYSAMTRARSNLFMTYTKFPSIFIQDMANTVKEENWLPSYININIFRSYTVE